MKITVMEGKRLPGEEPELVIYCHEADRNIEAICKYASNMGSFLVGTSGNDTCRLKPEEILYFEAVDGKVFAYLKEKVWQVGNFPVLPCAFRNSEILQECSNCP